MTTNLGVIERKVLGALMIKANEDGIVRTTMQDLAEAMDYKKSGGALTFALKILERDNFVVHTAKRTYKLLV